MVHATGDLGQSVGRLKKCTPDLLINRRYVQSMPGHARYARPSEEVSYVLDKPRG